ncbi:MAG: 4-hydroxy-tetrahydrodipicolinate reductase [Alphaproteobacteria bacterium]|nr:4-hydroxy-tetrahydrodipicolinate reductase [Alphaproteobacteria bacterium]
MRIAIAGAGGRMGQALMRAAGPGFTIVGGTERVGASQLGQDLGMLAALHALGAVAVETAADAARQADVWIDFTAPDATLLALDHLESTPVKAAIVGTTGLTASQEAKIAAHARRIAIVRAGNFSLGVNLLLALIEQAAARLGPDWDIEISETHHRRKVDAPSGTALMMGEAAAKGRGAELAGLRTPPYDGVTGPREAGRIGFAVSRAGGVIGDHEATFASDEEILTLGHRALDRAIFAKGALHAARWAVSQPPGLYSMRDVLSI